MTKVKTREPQLEKWFEWSFKAGVTGFASVAMWLATQLSTSVSAIQNHQVETDKRVAAIETDRNGHMPQYLAMETEFQNERIAVENIKIRLDQIDKTLDQRSSKVELLDRLELRVEQMEKHRR